MFVGEGGGHTASSENPFDGSKHKAHYGFMGPLGGIPLAKK